MLTIHPESTPQKDMHQYLLSAVSPRPIAFVSTIDESGVANLAPYSFFNAFSSNPPILVFSSNRRSDNNTTKDTLRNIELNKEAVINVVSHDIVRQMTLASIDYDSQTSEFDKAGFTKVASELVKPFRVKESPIQMECKIDTIIPLGDGPGAGHLIVCKVVRMHIDEHILDEQKRVDPHKLDIMGRMGRAFYVRASGAAVSSIVQPYTEIGIGFDQLPSSILKSTILTGNEIAEIASLTELPSSSEVAEYCSTDDEFQKIALNGLEARHQYAKELIAQRKKKEAACVLLYL